MRPSVTNIILTLLICLCTTTNVLSQAKRVLAEAEPGERIDQLLTRKGVDTSRKQLFIALNWRILSDNDGLMLGYKYSLPSADDIKKGKEIIERERKAREEYRQQKQLRNASAAQDAQRAKAEEAAKREKPKRIVEPLFGKDEETVRIVDDKLEGATYYLVSGHGGPDPGAMSTYRGQTICEDEYAYDVILRLARRLMSHRAKVHVIIQDSNDGIRDDAALACDDDETCMGAPIPLDQIKRLRQRCDTINSLYSKERKGYCRSIFIHVDSRSKDKRIDIFFYHYKKSVRGERLAKCIQAKLTEKYAKHQPKRGFSGEVKERDLFVLRETNPAGVFIEIGNIQNDMDMVRLAKHNNREAVARWIAEGMIEDFQKQ